jgi:PAS domain S-box-containing protein
MHPENNDLKRDLDETPNSPVRLFERYARGRIAYVWGRQILTVSGALVVTLLVSPLMGVASMLLAFTGELIDCTVLHYLLKRLGRGDPLAKLSPVAALSAGVQALTISGCVLIAWFGAAPETSTFFALAFLSSAGLNAGIVWPFHPPSAQARMAIYALTAIGGSAAQVLLTPALSPQTLFNVAATLIMIYIVQLIVKFVINGFERNLSDAAKMIAAAKALEDSAEKRKSTLEELRKLALVAKYANDSVIISGPTGRITWVNDAFTNITGYSFDEAIGRRPSGLLNGPETSAETTQLIFDEVSNGKPIRIEVLNYHKDGRKIWMETNLVPVKDESGEIEMVVAIERDITAIKEHEAEMATAKIAAERGERTKSEFLATMSHEIRKPMNGIIGLSELLEGCDLQGDAESYSKTIRSSAESLLTILNDILDYSKLDAGQVSIDPVEFDLKACISNCVALCDQQAVQKGIYLDIILDDPLPDRVIGDDGRLRQILINLIGNALKFTSIGGVTVKPTVQADGDLFNLGIQITDSGIGINPDRLESIFEKFSQADSATTRKFGGTGLGLTISRLLARRMGGDITVTSKEGEGSTFTVNITLSKSMDAPNEVAAMEPSDIERLSEMTVLVAEDNKTNRFMIKKFLQDLPINLSFAHDGREALEFAVDLPPDIIFMDMSMPEMDGLEATRRIRDLGGTQPYIVALTANAFASDKAACLEAGMDDFLTKPVRKVDLMGQLAKLSREPP